MPGPCNALESNPLMTDHAAPRIKIAIQKSGRLTDRSLDLLERCGLKYTRGRDQLLCFGENMPVDVLLVRDDDIPGLVRDDVCDLGIVGMNVLEERRLQFLADSATEPFRMVRPLDYGRCRLAFGYPEDGGLKTVADLQGRRVATSYPRIVEAFLKRERVDASVVEFAGAVEIAPSLGRADVVCDLVSTGSTLAANRLRSSHASVAAIALEARGSRDEVQSLRAALDGIRARIDDPAWRDAKQALLLEAAAPEFWKRSDRFERLGRAEYLDRIENAARAAASLLERIEGHPKSPRESYPRDVVRRLAQQCHLLEAASREALTDGPRDAFVAVEPMLDDTSPAVPARAFADRLAAMYAAWARARGMRFAQLETPDGSAEPRHLLAIAGFAAYALLQPEEGLHVLEEDEPGGRVVRRTTVRVRVLPQPAEPARDGTAGLLRQARERLTQRPATTTQVTRRYREGASPLVRDTPRGWRTPHIDRVLAGDFDLIQARE